MNFKDYMNSITPEQREELAEAAETSVGYLYQLSGGHRLCSHKLARRLEEATGGAVTIHDLRPDIFGEQKAAA